MSITKTRAIKPDTHTKPYIPQSESILVHPKILTRKSESVLIHLADQIENHRRISKYDQRLIDFDSTVAMVDDTRRKKEACANGLGYTIWI